MKRRRPDTAGRADADVGIRLGWLLDHPVTNDAGDELGRIEDVVIEPETGAIAYMLVATEVPSTAEPREAPVIALPYSDFAIRVRDEAVITDLDRDTLSHMAARRHDEADP